MRYVLLLVPLRRKSAVPWYPHSVRCPVSAKIRWHAPVSAKTRGRTRGVPCLNLPLVLISRLDRSWCISLLNQDYWGITSSSFVYLLFFFFLMFFRSNTHATEGRTTPNPFTKKKKKLYCTIQVALIFWLPSSGK